MSAWPRRVCSSAPAASQTLISPSPPPLPTRLPSGLKPTAHTLLGGPLGGRGDPAAVWAEGQAVNHRRVIRETEEPLAGCRIPQLDDAVGPGGGEHLAVWPKRHGGAGADQGRDGELIAVPQPPEVMPL